jgi:hypothetical protein
MEHHLALEGIRKPFMEHHLALEGIRKTENLPLDNNSWGHYDK